MKRTKTVENIGVLTLLMMMGLFVLYLSTHSGFLYERLSQKKEAQDQVRIAISYINSKVKQNDAEGVITVSDNQIVIQEAEGFVTYIFFEESGLYESLLSDTMSPSVDNGFCIAELDDFSVHQEGHHLHISVRKDECSANNVTIQIKSEQGFYEEEE